MKRLKRFITEWNIIMLIYLILSGVVAGQMMYIYHIKSELKTLKSKEWNKASNNGLINGLNDSE